MTVGAVLHATVSVLKGIAAVAAVAMLAEFSSWEAHVCDVSAEVAGGRRDKEKVEGRGKGPC